MKSLLAFAAIVGMYSAPAVAGSPKKKHRDTKAAAAATVAAVANATLADAAKPAAATTDAAGLELDIPALPPDTSSVLAPFAELERRPLPTAQAKPMKAGKAPTMKMGADFVLGRRQTSAKFERDVEQIIPRTLSQSQVATVVQAHMSDIKDCWELVPKAQRANACTAELRLSISDAGLVTDVELGGDVPASAHKCMTSAIAKWTFPVAETKTEIEYGVSLRSL
jgi:hypothetical protein